MKIDDVVKLKGDNDRPPCRFRIRAFRNDALEQRVSCRLIPRTGKRGGLYLFRLSEIELCRPDAKVHRCPVQACSRLEGHDGNHWCSVCNERELADVKYAEHECYPPNKDR